jgi:hypothetical protein
LTDTKHKRKAALRIHDKYLDKLSTSEININDTVRKELQEVFQKKSIDELQLDVAMKTLELAVLENLMDLFSRFSQSQTYKEYRRVKKVSRSAPTTPETPRVENDAVIPLLNNRSRVAKTKSVSFVNLKRMSTRFLNWKPS